jgi:hypothetical protein
VTVIVRDASSHSHVPLTHERPIAHWLVHVPQFVGPSPPTPGVPVERLTQVPEQLVSPLGHAHMGVPVDVEHVMPPAHVIVVSDVPSAEHVTTAPSEHCDVLGTQMTPPLDEDEPPLELLLDDAPLEDAALPLDEPPDDAPPEEPPAELEEDPPASSLGPPSLNRPASARPLPSVRVPDSATAALSAPPPPSDLTDSPSPTSWVPASRPSPIE